MLEGLDEKGRLSVVFLSSGALGQKRKQVCYAFLYSTYLVRTTYVELANQLNAFRLADAPVSVTIILTCRAIELLSLFLTLGLLMLDPLTPLPSSN